MTYEDKRAMYARIVGRAMLKMCTTDFNSKYGNKECSKCPFCIDGECAIDDIFETLELSDENAPYEDELQEDE